MKTQKGMPTVELISTIAIAGALSLAAMPKYEVIKEKVKSFNFSSEARQFYIDLREQN